MVCVSWEDCVSKCLTYPVSECAFPNNCPFKRKKSMTDCELFDGYNCSLYPKCSCTGFFDREKKDMANRCLECNTPDTCNHTGCINQIKNSVKDIYTMPQFSKNLDCPAPICGTPEMCDSVTSGCILTSACCNDPGDCNEPCRVDYGVVGNEDPEVFLAQFNDEEPELDGRNEGPVNKFGCSYVDCDCTRPCWEQSESNIINITINGDNYGDINV